MDIIIIILAVAIGYFVKIDQLSYEHALLMLLPLFWMVWRRGGKR